MSGTQSTTFYFANWMSDPNLRTCSAAARGIWMDLFCIAGLARSRHNGALLIGDHPPSMEGLSRLVGEPNVRALIDELKEKKAISFTPTGTIIFEELEQARPYIPGWAAIRKQIFSRDGHRCVYCESSLNLECDHIIPVSRGGPSTADNLVAACRGCNRGKGDRTPEEWGGP